MINPLKYAEDVLAGRVSTGELVRLAVERDLRDRERAKSDPAYPYVFNHEAGMHIVNFFHDYLRHFEGAWAGKPFILEPWQLWISYTVFGWRKKKDNTRRFRYAYVEVAKKNGKTPWMAGHMLYHLMADRESGAQVYTAASAQKQAALSFKHARVMAKNSLLKTYLKIEEHSIHMPKTESVMRALSSEDKSNEGVNVHAALVDEYHVHPNDGVFESLKSATVNRLQPMIWIITTAGFNKKGPCYTYRQMVIKLLQGTIEDDSLFGIIYTLDEGDDWMDERVWYKANPNLGVSVTLDGLRSEFTNAKNQSDKQVNFKTKNLNLWVYSQKTWIKDAEWMTCVGELNHSALKKKIAFGGLDLASVRDLTALSLFIPFEVEREVNEELVTEVEHKWLQFFWMPEDLIEERQQESGFPYRRMVEEGYIIATPGNATDYRSVEKKILELMSEYDIQGIAYDQHNSSQLVIELTEECVPLIKWQQGVGKMNAPIKEMEMLVAKRLLHHGGNPVLRWMAGNVRLKRNAYGDVMLDRENAQGKIDGIASGCMALGAWMENRLANKITKSVYEERGIRTIEF